MFRTGISFSLLPLNIYWDKKIDLHKINAKEALKNILKKQLKYYKYKYLLKEKEVVQRPTKNIKTHINAP